jgi:methylphosphotriester-DNA--protein-cysteine methyltransferase
MCEKNNLELGVEEIFENMTEEEKVDFLSRCSDEYEEEYEEEKYPLIEEQMELLALAEETSRLSNLKNDYEVSEETAKDKFFKEGMVVAETITAMVKEMVNNGIDYTNAVQIANNYFCAVNEKDAIVKMNKVNKVGGF